MYNVVVQYKNAEYILIFQVLQLHIMSDIQSSSALIKCSHILAVKERTSANVVQNEMCTFSPCFSFFHLVKCLCILLYFIFTWNLQSSIIKQQEWQLILFFTNFTTVMSLCYISLCMYSPVYSHVCMLWDHFYSRESAYMKNINVHHHQCWIWNQCLYISYLITLFPLNLELKITLTIKCISRAFLQICLFWEGIGFFIFLNIWEF